MDRLLTPDDVAGILQVGKRSAYGYMAQMVHMRNPLRVTEDSLRDWINRKVIDPEAKAPQRKKRELVKEFRIERR